MYRDLKEVNVSIKSVDSICYVEALGRVPWSLTLKSGSEEK
jgi:hypothetical protein